MNIQINISIEDPNISYLNAVLAEIIAIHAINLEKHAAEANTPIIPCSGSNCGHSWTLTVEEDD